MSVVFQKLTPLVSYFVVFENIFLHIWCIYHHNNNNLILRFLFLCKFMEVDILYLWNLNVRPLIRKYILLTCLY